jgi:1-deoxy-D-xylulose-5-phosphate reductoisomerase
MEIPVLYALAYPERLPYRTRRFDPVAASELTFEPVRRDCFPAFALGVAAGRAGGTAPAVFNAANEVAVAAFLAERIPFPAIPAAIDHALDAWGGDAAGSVEEVLAVDGWARQVTETFIENHALC